MAAAGPSERRSPWSTALAAFCALSVLFLVPRDLFFQETRDVEVWLGFELRGPAALWTAPLHWAVFAVGAWAFWSERPWIWRAAAAAPQVAELLVARVEAVVVLLVVARLPLRTPGRGLLERRLAQR